VRTLDNRDPADDNCAGEWIVGEIPGKSVCGPQHCNSKKPSLL
jgi:hypothetical protein